MRIQSDSGICCLDPDSAIQCTYIGVPVPCEEDNINIPKLLIHQLGICNDDVHC